jgi:hypothetical protein
VEISEFMAVTYGANEVRYIGFFAARLLQKSGLQAKQNRCGDCFGTKSGRLISVAIVGHKGKTAKGKGCRQYYQTYLFRALFLMAATQRAL